LPKGATVLSSLNTEGSFQRKELYNSNQFNPPKKFVKQRELSINSKPERSPKKTRNDKKTDEQKDQKVASFSDAQSIYKEVPVRKIMQGNASVASQIAG